MEPLTLEEFDDSGYDALVARTPYIDRFCSSTPWIIPAHTSLMPPRKPWLWRSEHGYVALAKGFDARVGHYLQPLEGAWNFTTGLVATNPLALVEEVAHELRQSLIAWNLVLLSGVVPRSPYHEAILRAFGPHHRIGVGGTTVRHRAMLEEGLDAFLGRRSRKFRQNLRRASRKADDAGMTLERHYGRGVEATREVFARVLDVETRSWKGIEGVGITEGSMHDFYEAMVPRLAERDQLRVTFARIGELDVGYILGGVLDKTYRGLQISYDADYRDLSIGNLLQRATIEDMIEEGVTVYDLGCEIDYKSRWSDENMTTFTIAVFR